jgi:hypothetical protein
MAHGHAAQLDHGHAAQLSNGLPGLLAQRHGAAWQCTAQTARVKMRTRDGCRPVGEPTGNAGQGWARHMEEMSGTTPNGFQARRRVECDDGKEPHRQRRSARCRGSGSGNGLRRGKTRALRRRPDENGGGVEAVAWSGTPTPVKR